MTDPQTPATPADTTDDPTDYAPPGTPSRRARLAARWGSWRRGVSRSELLVALGAAAVVLVVGLGGFFLGHATAGSGSDERGSSQHHDGLPGDRGEGGGRGGQDGRGE